jgi:hypothetical protein
MFNGCGSRTLLPPSKYKAEFREVMARKILRFTDPLAVISSGQGILTRVGAAAR